MNNQRLLHLTKHMSCSIVLDYTMSTVVEWVMRLDEMMVASSDNGMAETLVDEMVLVMVVK
jgi:rRNA-processing protein FCF1